jgi:hypothetical protein
MRTPSRVRYKGRVTLVSDLQTPALVIDAALAANLRTMAAALPARGSGRT